MGGVSGVGSLGAVMVAAHRGETMQDQAQENTMDRKTEATSSEAVVAALHQQLVAFLRNTYNRVGTTEQDCMLIADTLEVVARVHADGRVEICVDAITDGARSRLVDVGGEQTTKPVLN